MFWIGGKEKMTKIITKKEWTKIHKDYKTIINGQKYILVLNGLGSILQPVEVIK
mgnify:CR=1 FL=1